MSAPTTLGICVVNYNSADAVRELADSLTKLGIRAELCIVDNSDQKEELVALVENLKGTPLAPHLLRPERNLGYGAGNNLAATKLLQSGVDVLWILNPDVQVLELDFPKLCRRLKSSPSTLWSTVTLEDGRTTSGLRRMGMWCGKSHVAERKKKAQGVIYPAGHSIVLSRDVWRSVGGFDEDYFLFYEEVDLALRARKLGIKIDCLDAIYVAHAKGLTTGANTDPRLKSTRTFEYAAESGVLFMAKLAPGHLPVFLTIRLAYALAMMLYARPAAGISVLSGLWRGTRRAFQLIPLRRWGPR